MIYTSQLWGGYALPAHLTRVPVSAGPPVTSTLTLNADAEIIASPGSNRSIVVIAASATNTSATLTVLNLREGAGGTIRYSMALAINGGGFVKQFLPYWVLPAATALDAIITVAVTDVRLNVDFFIV